MYRLHILILMIFPLITHGQTEDGVKSGIITVNFKIVENAFVDFVLIDSLGNRTDTFHLAYYPGVFKSENGKWPDMSGFEKISIIIKCQGNKGIEQYQGTFDLFKDNPFLCSPICWDPKERAGIGNSENWFIYIKKHKWSKKNKYTMLIRSYTQGCYIFSYYPKRKTHKSKNKHL